MYNIEDTVGFILAKAYRKGFGIFKGRLAKYRVTPPQFSILAFLWQQDGLTQAELSEKSEIDRATIVGLIDRLADEGLVTRQPYKGDRRAYRICLTDKGKALEGRLGAIAEKTNQEFTKTLTKPEIKSLKEMLNKLRR